MRRSVLICFALQIYILLFANVLNIGAAEQKQPVQQRSHFFSKLLTKTGRATRSLLHREKVLILATDRNIELAYQKFVEDTKSKKMEGNTRVYSNWKPMHCVANHRRESMCDYFLQTANPIEYNSQTVTVGSCVQKEVIFTMIEVSEKYLEWIYPCANVILASKKNDIFTFENAPNRDDILHVTGHYVFAKPDIGPYEPEPDPSTYQRYESNSNSKPSRYDSGSNRTPAREFDDSGEPED